MYARLQFLLKPCMTGQGLLGSFVHFSLSILSPYHHYHLPDSTGEPRTWWVSVPVLLEPHVGSAPGRGLAPRKGGCSGNPGGHGAEQCVCFHWAQGSGWGHLEAQLVADAAIRLSEAEHFLGELEEVHTDTASPEDTLRLRALDPRAPWSEGLSEGMKKEAPGSQAEGAFAALLASPALSTPSSSERMKRHFVHMLPLALTSKGVMGSKATGF